MTQIEKIKAEIERKKEIHFKDYHINKNSNSTDYGACNALTQLLSFIDSLEEETVSNDLEEAAHSYVNTTIEWFDSEGNPYCYPAFIAGAQWQKERMLNNAIEREVKVDAGGYPYIDVTELYDYDKDRPLAKKGDKVKLIIIMEE